MSDFSVHSMLQQMPYFAHVAESTLSELAQQAVHRTFAANEMIFLEGEPSAGLWIVENGRVKAYKLSPRARNTSCIFWVLATPSTTSLLSTALPIPSARWP